MTLDFLPEAAAEFCEAAERYEARQPGLGARFRSELLDVCRSIVLQPLLWRERPGGYRRVNCPVFPYYVAYFIRGDLILVAAAGHGHRRPGYWKTRLPKE
jgi:plasmid stabilization system protein ParE